MKTLYAAALCLMPAMVTAEDVQRGEELFWMHCAACHGIEARGDGALARAMKVPPPDLTTLAADNAGTFPTTRVILRIHGTDPTLDLNPDMPTYGPFFAVDDTPTKAETGQPIMSSSPVIDLVAYLRTLQVAD